MRASITTACWAALLLCVHTAIGASRAEWHAQAGDAFSKLVEMERGTDPADAARKQELVLQVLVAGKPSVAFLLDGLQSDDDAKRRTAAMVLFAGVRYETEAKYLQTQEERAFAARTLRNLRPFLQHVKEARPDLMEAAAAAQAPEIRKRLFAAAAAGASAAEVQRLLDLAGDDNAAYSAVVEHAFVMTPDLASEPQMLEAVTKRLSEVIEEDASYLAGIDAAKALGAPAAPLVKDIIVEAVATAEDVKEPSQYRLPVEALSAIAHIGPPAVDQLIPMLKDENAHVRARAAAALGWMFDSLLHDDPPKPPEAVREALRQAQQDKDPHVAETADQALSGMG